MSNQSNITVVEGPRAGLMGFTYIVQRVSDQHIKIGSTFNWPGRAMNLRSKATGSIRPIVMVRGAFGVELILHAHLEPYHVGGEWFCPAPEVLEAVTEIALGIFEWSKAPSEGWCITKSFQTKASLSHWGRLPRFEARATQERAA